MDFEDPSKKKGKISASLANDGLIPPQSLSDPRPDFGPRNRKTRYQANSSVEIRSSLTAGRTFTREQLAQLKAPPPRRSSSNPALRWFLGLTSGVAGLVAVLTLANSTFFDSLLQRLRKDDVVAMAITSDQFSAAGGGGMSSGYLFNYSLFGPQAVATCKRRCMISGGDSCSQDCDLMELSRFPYERLRENINPRRDVAKSNYLCQEGAKTMTPAADTAAWQQSFDPAISLIKGANNPDKSNSVAQLRLLMTQLEKSLTELKLPPQSAANVEADAAITADLYRALCLTYSTNLARLGSGVGVQAGDRNIEHYYADFAVGASEIISELQGRLLLSAIPKPAS